MPVYEYEHLERACTVGKVFEHTQSIHDKPLNRCPECNELVRKLISYTSFSAPKTNSELRDLGFTKLVKRDNGVYENVTARDGESKLMIRGKPETIPDIKKTIRD